MESVPLMFQDVITKGEVNLNVVMIVKEKGLFVSVGSEIGDLVASSGQSRAVLMGGENEMSERLGEFVSQKMRLLGREEMLVVVNYSSSKTDGRKEEEVDEEAGGEIWVMEEIGKLIEINMS